MEYTRLVTDYDTGEVYRTNIGEHLTVTELADRLEVGRRTLTDAMLSGGLCVREHDDIAEKTRVRLHPDAAEKGLGYRIMGQHGPFDVLSPVGREVAEQMLRDHIDATCPTQWKPAFEALEAYERWRKGDGLSPLSAQMRYCWLVDNVDDLPVSVIAQGLGVSVGLVYRFMRRRNANYAAAHRRRLIGATFDDFFEAS